MPTWWGRGGLPHLGDCSSCHEFVSLHYRCISFHNYPTVYLFNININIISIITAGIAVLLTIVTYFSTQILTKIFGDGSLEVRELSQHKKKHCLLGGGARGLGWLQRPSTLGGETHKLIFSRLWIIFEEKANNAETQEAAEQEVTMEALTSGSNKVNKIKVLRIEQLFLYRLLLRLTWFGERSKTRRPWWVYLKINFDNSLSSLWSQV